MRRAMRLVGRDRELGQLAAAIGRARDGKGGLVAISGAPGVGKSALVRHALGSQVDCVVGRTSPPPNAAAQPLADVASALVQRGADPGAADLVLHRGALRVLLPSAALAVGETERPAPVHLADALIGLVSQLEGRRPHVLLIEDLHWADALTVQTIDQLADRCTAAGVLVVVTGRNGAPCEGLFSRIRGRHAGDHIELQPLTDAATAELVQHCVDGDPPTSLFDAMAVADGVPLQIEELLLAYEQSGSLHVVNGQWRFEPAAGEVPSSVLDGARVRLGQLPDSARQVIDAASLLGRRFDATVLGDALGAGPKDVDEGLRAGLRCGLLAPEPGALRPHFAHELVREAVVAEMGEATRRLLAARLLGAAERVGGDDDQARIAALALLAGDERRAAEAYVRCGQHDLARGLLASAIERFDAALALERTAAAALPIREVLLQALALAGDVTRARAVGAVVERQLDAAGAERARRDRCVLATVRAAVHAAAWTEADVAITPLVGRPLPDPAAQAVAALVALERGDTARAGSLAQAVVGSDAAAPEDRCEAFEVLGRLARGHDLDEAAQWFDRAIATAELADLDLWAARASHERATISQLRTLDVADLYAARERAVVAGAPALMAAVDFHLAAVHGVRFEPEPALQAARRVLDAARQLGAPRQEAWAWNLVGQAHAAAGRRDRARAAAGEALSLASEDDEVAAIAVGTAQGLASLLADDRERGCAEVMAAVGRLRASPARVPLPPWYLWPLLATVYDLEGDGGSRARSETDDPALRVTVGVDGTWNLAEAVALGRAGDSAGAEAAAAAAEQRFGHAPGFAGYAHLARRIAADAAVRDGWGDPGAWLEAAGAWAGAHGHEGMRAACASLGRRAGVPQRRRRKGGAEVPAALASRGVTSREMDVLALVCEGLTNAEIAGRLYLSPRTVKGYVENLLAKLSVANRTQLTAYAKDVNA